MTGNTLFGLLDLLLVFAAVGGFAWWQLRDLARERSRRNTQVERQPEAPPEPKE